MRTPVESSNPIRIRRLVHGPDFSATALRPQPGTMWPLLGVDHFRMGKPTFGPHPHEGISALTYVFEDSCSEMSNRDSLGTACLIGRGALHWTLAGRGIVHEEVPAAPGTVHGLQIFVDLPPSGRSVKPRAMQVASESMPVHVQRGGSRVKVVYGNAAQAGGKGQVCIDVPTRIDLLDVTVPQGGDFRYEPARESDWFAYVVAGAVAARGRRFEAGEAFVGCGDISLVESQARDSHLFLFATHSARD